MASYRVSVRIDPAWVQHFRDTDIRLCTAFGVKSNYSGTEYNIIATSEGLLHPVTAHMYLLLTTRKIPRP
jgi:hypothetical protein